jgi:hypothetical protein
MQVAFRTQTQRATAGARQTSIMGAHYRVVQEKSDKIDARSPAMVAFLGWAFTDNLFDDAFEENEKVCILVSEDFVSVFTSGFED